MLWEKLPHKNTIKMTGGGTFLMGKIGGGFGPFLAGKMAGFDSELLHTLHVYLFHGFISNLSLGMASGNISLPLICINFELQKF